MRKRPLGLIFLAASFILAVNGQTSFADHKNGQVVKEDWVVRYNGPGDSEDQAEAIALDNYGNVYTTGSSWGSGSANDYATIKYDTNGNELWAARYNGSGNYHDLASAIAVDNSGNVYVTGYASRSWGVYDYATIKYDPNGNRLWVAFYNGPGNLSDYATAIAVDSFSNVYVTGYVGVSASQNEYATIKYDTNGNQLWVARYNGPAEYDAASAIAVDNLGNVYVTGGGSGSMADYATIKYDPNGNQLWAARYNGPGNSYDGANAIAVDGLGNVYVTGRSDEYSLDFDYATIKYDSDGNELWVSRYNGPGNEDDWARALALDDAGNVYVTGNSMGDGTRYDYASIKYDTNGNELWVVRYNGPAENHDDYAYGITLDAPGNIYVTGKSSGVSLDSDYATIKYDTNGNELWVARYDGPKNDDGADSIAVDNSGNVYVIGDSEGGGFGHDYATIKYLQLPTVSIDLQEYDNVLHRGEDLQYQVTLTNNSDRDQIVNYWSQVKDGNGSLREAVLPTPVTLGPNEIYTTEYSHAIPGKSPKDQYEYIGNVGEDVDHLWDEDTFTFNIVPPGIFDLNLEEGAR